jgi:hypothetical protein
MGKNADRIVVTDLLLIETDEKWGYSKYEIKPPIHVAFSQNVDKTVWVTYSLEE